MTEADYRKIKVCVEDMLRATNLAVDLRRTGRQGLGELKQAECEELERAARRPLGPLMESFSKGASAALVDSLAKTSQRLYTDQQLVQEMFGQGEGQPADDPNPITTSLWHLEGDQWLHVLQKGAYFLKIDRYHRRNMRFVCVTADKQSLYWRRVVGTRPPTVLPLSDILRVECAKGGQVGEEELVTLVGKQGKRSVQLVVLNTYHAHSSQEAEALAKGWSRGLNRLLEGQDEPGEEGEEEGHDVEEAEEVKTRVPLSNPGPGQSSLFRVNLSPVDRDVNRSPPASFTPRETADFTPRAQGAVVTPRVLPAATPHAVGFLPLEPNSDDSSYVTDDEDL